MLEKLGGSWGSTEASKAKGNMVKTAPHNLAHSVMDDSEVDELPTERCQK